jgi:protein phosphatase
VIETCRKGSARRGKYILYIISELCIFSFENPFYSTRIFKSILFVQGAKFEYMVIKTCYRSEKGMRQKNEDYCRTWVLKQGPDSYTLLALADGVGAYPGGDVASSIAVNTFHQMFRYQLLTWSRDHAGLDDLTRASFAAANSRVNQEAQSEPRLLGMATTLVTGVLGPGGKGFIASVGDSRAYVLKDGLTQVTCDHTVYEEQRNRGMAPGSLYGKGMGKNQLTRIIGSMCPEPDIFPIELSGGRLLLCSDGLTEGLTDDRIAGILALPDIREACNELVIRALEKSRDNVSAIVAAGVPGPEPSV